MDRIAAQRTSFPRSTLMTIAESGLRARNLWSGQIKRFAEDVAPVEANWRDSFTEYHQQLIEAASPSAPAWLRQPTQPADETNE